MIAFAVGSLVLTVVVVMFVYGIFSFAGLGNYAILTGQSRLSLDQMSREIRESTHLLDCNATGTSRWITLSNAYTSSIITYSWDATSGILRSQKTGEAERVRLTGCDQWDISFYQRTPSTNWTFYSTANNGLCKLVNMNWKCSRSILGKKINTENVVTAQVVLRNK